MEFHPAASILPERTEDNEFLNANFTGTILSVVGKFSNIWYGRIKSGKSILTNLLLYTVLSLAIALL